MIMLFELLGFFDGASTPVEPAATVTTGKGYRIARPNMVAYINGRRVRGTYDDVMAEVHSFAAEQAAQQAIEDSNRKARLAARKLAKRTMPVLVIETVEIAGVPITPIDMIEAQRIMETALRQQYRRYVADMLIEMRRQVNTNNERAIEAALEMLL